MCLDKLYADEDSGADCLVYSFASGKTDWTFERAMALAGCRVRAFDPTVTAGHQRPPDLPDSVELHPFALSDKSGEVDLVMPSTKKVLWTSACASCYCCCHFSVVAIGVLLLAFQ